MQSRQVLYIEDRVTATEKVMEVLEDLNCSVRLANTVNQVRHFIGQYGIDLVILNVDQREHLWLLELVAIIKGENLPIIFLASESNRTLYEHAKKANLVAYLVSPIDMLTFRSIIEYNFKKTIFQINNNYKRTEEEFLDDTLFIKVNQLLQKVSIRDITHIRSEGNYCMIFTNEKKYAIKISMIRLFNNLLGNGFIQAHKSYLVQLSKIDNIDISSNEVLIGDIRIPLGRKYKQELLTYLNLL